MPTASSPMPNSTLSILFPFDIGRSYIFHVRMPSRQDPGRRSTSLDEGLNQGSVQFAAWKRIFEELDGRNEHLPPNERTSKWTGGDQFDYFENPLSKPLGFRATLKIEPNDSRLQEYLKGFDWLVGTSAEVSFFPFGVGVFVLRVPPESEPSVFLKSYWERRKELQVQIAFILNILSTELRAILDAEMQLGSLIYELADVRRKGRTSIAKYSFPLVFTRRKDEFCDLGKKSRGRDLSLSAVEQRGDSVKSYCFKGEEVELQVGWSESYIRESSAEFKKAIEDIFTIAMAGWFALVIMNKIAASYLLDALKDVAANEGTILKQKSRTMRLTFMDAASSSRPIRWTANPDELTLLEHIHEVWGSKRILEQVEEQTRTLAAHHDQLEEEEKERKGIMLALLGLLIASVTFISAVADERALLPKGHYWKVWIHGNGAWFGPVIAVFLSFILALVFRQEIFVLLRRLGARVLRRPKRIMRWLRGESVS